MIYMHMMNDLKPQTTRWQCVAFGYYFQNVSLLGPPTYCDVARFCDYTDLQATTTVARV